MSRTSTHHSLGGITLTIPLRMPHGSTPFMYCSKLRNSSIEGLNTGIPRWATGSVAGSSHVRPFESGDGGSWLSSWP